MHTHTDTQSKVAAEAVALLDGGKAVELVQPVC